MIVWGSEGIRVVFGQDGISIGDFIDKPFTPPDGVTIITDEDGNILVDDDGNIIIDDV